MQVWLTNRIKKLGENIESTITQVIVLGLLGGSVAVLAFWKKGLNYVHTILTKPTPLWITIIMGLLYFLYIHLKFRSYSFPNDRNKIKLSKLDLDILICFGQLPDDRSLTANDLSQHFGSKYNQTQYAIDNLCSYDFLMRETPFGEDTIYWLSVKGRDYLAKKNLL